MSLEYIRRVYKVPAKRGMAVRAEGQKGRILGARGPYLRILLEGEIIKKLFHPTWEMEYLTEEETDD